MSDWQDRVLAERLEVAQRLEKLAAFIEDDPGFKALGVEDRHLLTDQRWAMGRYVAVLDKRIARFG